MTPKKQRTVKAFAITNKYGSIVLIQNYDEIRHHVYMGMDDKTYLREDLAIVPCRITLPTT